MNTNIKTYKIMVDSKPFTNMRGSTPAEVAKKAASKILGNSLNRVRFSIQEKTGKIRHYDAKWENLVRPYHKNGKLIKYRIIVKKLGKQVGGTYPPNLEDESDPIFQFFPKEEYDIDDTWNIRITSGEDWCCTFYVEDENELFLDFLFKCNGNTGSRILNKIIEYGKYLKTKGIIERIKLEDDSYIKIGNQKFSLSLLSILRTGSSWYNNFGFISDQFEDEQKNNIQFLSMNLSKFLNLCIENRLRYYFEKLNNDIELQRVSISIFARNELEKLLKKRLKRNSLPRNNFIENFRLKKITKRDAFIRIFGDKEVKTLFTEIKNKLIDYTKFPREEINNIHKLFEFIESSGIIMYKKKYLILTL